MAISIKNLNAALGAEIDGIDLSRPLDDALFHYLGNRERLMRVR